MNAVAVVEAEEVAAAMQTSCVQTIYQDSENSTDTVERCRRLVCEVAGCGDDQLEAQSTDAGDCITSTCAELETEQHSVQLSSSLTHSVENHIAAVASASQLQSVFISHF